MSLNQTQENGDEKLFDLDLSSKIQDQTLIKAWVHGKSQSTKRAYLRIARELIGELHPKNLKQAHLEFLQWFISFRSGLKPESIKQRTAIIKSLFTFAHETGYLPGNETRLIRLPKRQTNRASRYLTEEEVLRMITLTHYPRDRALLKVLYSGGMRISELCALKWMDVQVRGEGKGQLSILGKGDKKREVVISASTFKELIALKSNECKYYEHVFRSQERGSLKLSQQMIRVIVRQAALRAGIKKKVSPHWMRHAHASHSLDRGAPLHLVQAQLGHENISTTGEYLTSRPQDSSSQYLLV